LADLAKNLTSSFYGPIRRRTLSRVSLRKPNFDNSNILAPSLFLAPIGWHPRPQSGLKITPSSSSQPHEHKCLCWCSSSFFPSFLSSNPWPYRSLKILSPLGRGADRRGRSTRTVDCLKTAKRM
ncbi:hypothetical protein TYRP_013347, partial [Tyrophagus putrescentiae]